MLDGMKKVQVQVFDEYEANAVILQLWFHLHFIVIGMGIEWRTSTPSGPSCIPREKYRINKHSKWMYCKMRSICYTPKHFKAG